MLCAGAAPPNASHRLLAHLQRCAALPEPGMEYCAIHGKAKGYLRCAQCGFWTLPQAVSRSRMHVTWQCANGCYLPTPPLTQGDDI